MNRRLLKNSVLAAVSLVLLYYNIAWAVLRCPHQENHSDLEIAFYDTASHTTDIFLSGPSRRQVNLDCTGPQFHTEMLAEPSTGSEFPWLVRDVASRVNVLFAWSGAQDPAQQIWRKAFLIKGSFAGFHLPQYLSLSVLRL